MVPYLLAVLSLAARAHCGTDWPVFFEHLGRVHSIHNKWDLTFAVKTNFQHYEERLHNVTRQIKEFQPKPEEEPKSEGKSPEEGSEDSEEDKMFRLVEEHWVGLTELLQKRTRVLEGRLRDYRSLGDNRRGGRSAGGFEEDRGDSLSRGMERLSWAQPRMLWGNAEVSGEEASLLLSRGKRQADCITVGGLANFLFGFTYQQNLECVSRQLELLKGTMKDDVTHMVESQNRFSSRTERELGETKSMVAKVEGMTRQMERKVLVMERTGGGGKSHTSLALQQLDGEIRECEQFLDEIERVVSSLAGGRLAQSLVPPPVLRHHLTGVEEGLPANFSLLYPATESLWPYYSVLATSIYFSKNFEEMYVHLSIPLCDRGNDLSLYRVHNLPLKVRDGYSVTADLDTEYILTAREGKYHLELSKEDFQDCQVYQQSGQQFFCGFGPLLQSTKSSSCVIQLFNVDGEGAMCQSRLTHGLVQPFTRLYNGSWVFAALSAQVPVEMHCPQSTIPTSLLGFGVINLMEGCTLSSSDFHYPHTFTGYTDVSLSFNSETPVKKMEEEDEYEDYEEYVVPQKPPFHYDTDEALIIDASEVEEQQEVDKFSDLEVHDYFTDDMTTIVSVKSSVEVVNNTPEKEDTSDVMKKRLVTKDNFLEHTTYSNKELLPNTEHSNTENPFTEHSNTEHSNTEHSNTEFPKTELKLMPEGLDTVTELHHNVLLKLRDKIKNGKHWLDDFTSAVKEIKREAN